LFSPLGADYAILAARERVAGEKALKRLEQEAEARNADQALFWERKYLEETGSLAAELGVFHDAETHLARISGRQDASTGRVSFEERRAQWAAAEQARLRELEERLSFRRREPEAPVVEPAVTISRLRRQAAEKVAAARKWRP
jgi:hypothetical protein